MHPLNPRPVGSIENATQLRLLCNRGGTIHIVNGVRPSIETVNLTGMRVYQGGTSGFVGYDESRNGVRHYLADMNVDASYNCNYAFIRSEDATAFVEFLVKDPAVLADRQEWLAECDEWESYIDSYETDYNDDFDREEGYC
jgi:hypothetical protein